MVDIILREDVEQLGKAGEEVTVRPGYARNYLIPKGMAMPASPGNRRLLMEEQRRRTREESRKVEAAQKIAKQLEGVALTFARRAGEKEKLFGSVTTVDIASELEQLDIQVPRQVIRLDEPIKTLGLFEIPIRLHAEVEPTIKVWVVSGD